MRFRAENGNSKSENTTKEGEPKQRLVSVPKKIIQTKQIQTSASHTHTQPIEISFKGKRNSDAMGEGEILDGQAISHPTSFLVQYSVHPRSSIPHPRLSPGHPVLDQRDRVEQHPAVGPNMILLLLLLVREDGICFN